MVNLYNAIHKALRLLIPLLAATLLSGCGTFADPTTWFETPDPSREPAELADINNQIQPVELWSLDTGAGAEDQANLRPAAYAGQIFVVDAEGLVQALDAESAQLSWRVETDLPTTAGPGVGEGLVLLGTSEAQVIALDQYDGSERWRAEVSSEVLAVPAAADGMVVVHTIDGSLFGLDAVTGEQRWRYDRKVPVLTLRGSSSPVISNGVVFCGLAGGKMIALSLETGQLDWEENVSLPTGRSDLERMTDIDVDPVLYNGAVFVSSYQGRVAALGEASGKIFWTRDLSAYTNLAVNWQLLYVTDELGNVWALDPDTGAARWRLQDLANRKLSAPAILGDYVVVGDFEGYLHWLSTSDGAIVARTRVSSDAITAPPLVVNETLYVLDSGGELAAIRL